MFFSGEGKRNQGSAGKHFYLLLEVTDMQHCCGTILILQSYSKMNPAFCKPKTTRKDVRLVCSDCETIVEQRDAMTTTQLAVCSLSLSLSGAPSVNK